MNQEIMNKMLRSNELLNYAIKNNITDKEVLNQLYAAIGYIKDAIEDLEKL